ncbi:hypothetical protein RI367_004854 [Sorochytrium milnesiophthora]
MQQRLPATVSPRAPLALPLDERAAFATSSRLICAFVNEGMASARLSSSSGALAVVGPPSQPFSTSPGGALSSLRLTQNNGGDDTDGDSDDERHQHRQQQQQEGRRSNVLLLLPLRNVPVSSSSAAITYIDPDDLLAPLFRLCVTPPSAAGHSGTTGPDGDIDGTNNVSLTSLVDPLDVLAVVAEWNGLDADAVQRLSRELTSSVAFQRHIYSQTAPRPSLESSPYDWEQAIVEGHATHPMHRARYAAPPLQIHTSSNLNAPAIMLYVVPRTDVHTFGEYLSTAHPHLLKSLRISVPDTHVVVPVHELQVPKLRELFPQYELLCWPDEPTAPQRPVRIPSLALTSLRTLQPVGWGTKAFDGHDVKVSISMTTTSAMRTISNLSVMYSPMLSQLAELLCHGNDAIQVIRELASVGVLHADPDVQKCMGCVIRADPDVRYPGQPALLPGEKSIICAGLVERDVLTGVPNVVHAFNLRTEHDKLRFLETYADLLFSAVLPIMRDFGFTFEAHGQNSVLRIAPCPATDAKRRDSNAFNGYQLVGFGMRDYGGVRLHRPTLEQGLDRHLGSAPARAETVRELLKQVKSDAWLLADTLDDVYKIGYHTTIFCHLHRLVRALDLHATGAGWAVVRTLFDRHVPRTSPLHAAWTRPAVDLKSFIIMKCSSLYRDYVYREVPNVMLTPVRAPRNMSGDDAKAAIVVPADVLLSSPPTSPVSTVVDQQRASFSPLRLEERALPLDHRSNAH